MVEVNLKWKEGLLFLAEQDNQKYYLGAGDETGVSNKGIMPKTMLLSALAGCSGMDVVSLLKKMRVSGYELQINVSASSIEEHPQVFKDIKMTFQFEGKELPIDKIRKSIDLSVNRYCPVHAMLSKAVPINTEIIIDGEKVEL